MMLTEGQHLIVESVQCVYISDEINMLVHVSGLLNECPIHSTKNTPKISQTYLRPEET